MTLGIKDKTMPGSPRVEASDLPLSVTCCALYPHGYQVNPHAGRPQGFQPPPPLYPLHGNAPAISVPILSKGLPSDNRGSHRNMKFRELI
jgi:hypothetical protein